MSKLLQEIVATLIAGMYFVLLIASFFFFSTLTFFALLFLPVLLCIPILMGFFFPMTFVNKIMIRERRLTKDEAYKILGLDNRASPEDVLDAHRRLVALNHPDRGGSTYLIQLIHNAKDLLMADFEKRRAIFTVKEL